ncbi:MAG: GxxExxY protein [Candidatus Brocadia sp.]|nr:GxxExxY protein [Candidatus Brocadia sp.]
MESIDTKCVYKSMKKDLRTHAIIGAAMEVHNVVGPGHLEAVYQECLEIEFEIKAEKSLTRVDEAQLINSLVISRHDVGLLLNFGEESLRYKRFVN